MFSLHVDTARSWRGGQNHVLLTVLGLRAQGHRTALVAHPDGELQRRAVEGPDLVPIASSGEMDLRETWQLSLVLKALRPTVVQAHDAHAVAMVALARSLGRLDPLPRLVVSRRVDFHIRGNAFSRWKYAQVDLLPVRIGRDSDDACRRRGAGGANRDGAPRHRPRARRSGAQARRQRGGAGAAQGSQVSDQGCGHGGASGPGRSVRDRGRG